MLTSSFCPFSGPVVNRKQLRRFLKTDQNEKRSDEALGVQNSPLVAAFNDTKNTSEEALKAKMTSQEKPECVEMPPELCLKLGFPASVIRSAYLLPSVMYRLKSVMLASQLRQSIHAPKIPVMTVSPSLLSFCAVLVSCWVSYHMSMACFDSKRFSAFDILCSIFRYLRN